MSGNNSNIIAKLLGLLFKAVCGGPSTTPQEDQLPQQQQQQYPPPQQHQGQWSHGPPQQQQQQQQGGQWEQAPTHHKPPQNGQPYNGEPSPAPHGGASPRPPGHVDQNQINQRNPQYTSLRAQANQEGDAMARAFDESHKAYESRDGARAKELSNEGKEHQRKMNELNRQASDWIFIENNKDSQPGEIDLHGLYVKEAITYTEKAIQEARQRGDPNVHLIVGKGIHSQNHLAKIKPAIEDLMQRESLVAELDPQNTGVLIVHLGGEPSEGIHGRALNPDDMTRTLEKGEQCVIM